MTAKQIKKQQDLESKKAAERWALHRAKVKADNAKLKESKPMDSIILYSILILAVGCIILTIFGLYNEALATTLVIGFLGSMNCVVNRNRLAIPFIILLVTSLILLFV